MQHSGVGSDAGRRWQRELLWRAACWAAQMLQLAATEGFISNTTQRWQTAPAPQQAGAVTSRLQAHSSGAAWGA
jgi:hypothetical protein